MFYVWVSVGRTKSSKHKWQSDILRSSINMGSLSITGYLRWWLFLVSDKFLGIEPMQENHECHRLGLSVEKLLNKITSIFSSSENLNNWDSMIFYLLDCIQSKTVWATHTKIIRKVFVKLIFQNGFCYCFKSQFPRFPLIYCVWKEILLVAYLAKAFIQTQSD